VLVELEGRHQQQWKGVEGCRDHRCQRLQVFGRGALKDGKMWEGAEWWGTD